MTQQCQSNVVVRSSLLEWLEAERRQPSSRTTDEGARGVIVLGMHRSGTSAVSGLIAGAGFSLGGGHVWAADEHNEPGYFELANIVRLDDEILAAVGATWDRPPNRRALDTTVPRYAGRIADLVEHLLVHAAPAPLVVKDPRVSVLLPTWRHLIGSRLAPVLVVRNPYETALSLHKRDNFPIPVGLALWEVTMRTVLDGLHGKPAYVARYEQLMVDPAAPGSLLEWCRSQLTPEAAAHVTTDSSNPVSSRYRRNRAEETALEAGATGEQIAVWRFLHELGSGPRTIVVPAGLRAESNASLDLLNSRHQLVLQS